MKRLTYHVLYQDCTERGMECIHEAPGEQEALAWADGDVAPGNVYYIQPRVKTGILSSRPLPPTKIIAVWRAGGEVFHGTVDEYQRFQYCVRSIGKAVICLSNSAPCFMEGTLVGFVSVSQSKSPMPMVKDTQGVDHICLGPVLLDMPKVRGTIEDHGAEKALEIMTALNQVRVKV